MSAQTTITQETFDGLAFPVIRVKYAGPTDTKGARWIASMRRDNERSYRVTVGYDSGEREGAANAIHAARACWEKACDDLGVPKGEHVAIPADLSASEYAFTMVPEYILNH